MAAIGFVFIAMKLKQANWHLCQCFMDKFGARIDEQPHDVNEGRQCRNNGRCLFRHDIARTLRIENETDGVSTGCCRGNAILNTGDAADLDTRFTFGHGLHPVSMGAGNGGRPQCGS